MLRLLFIGFLILNILVLFWQWQLDEVEEESLVRVGQPEQNRLSLAEGHQLARAATAEESVPDRPDPAWRPEGCLHLGGIDDADALREVAHRLGIADPELIADVERQAVAWWVLLPPEAVDDPDELRETFADQPVGDFFFIRSGEASGGVSFGLFSTEGRAESREAALRHLGHEVEIRPRWDEIRRYWFAIPLDLPLDLPQVAPDLMLELSPAICPDDRPSLVAGPEDSLE